MEGRRRVALVTGASSGIGEATVRALAAAGFETVSNPAVARARTVASPIPLEAPVTSATFRRSFMARG